MRSSRLPWLALPAGALQPFPSGATSAYLDLRWPSMAASAVLGSPVLYTCSPQKESIITNAILNRIAALYALFLCVSFPSAS